MKKYVSPNAILLTFSREDILSTSGGGGINLPEIPLSRGGVDLPEVPLDDFS